MADENAALQTPISLPPPPRFNFENPGEWTQWILQFEDYSFASGLYRATDEVKVRTLLYTMGSQEARRILETLGLAAADWASFDTVKEKFKAYFVHPPNEVYESVKFHRRIQEEGETVDNFVTALRELVKKCNYASKDVEDRLVRDRFVVGLRDSSLSDKLCRSTKLTLEDAVLQARIHEDALKARADAFKGTGQFSTENSASLSEARFGQRRRFQPRSSQKGAKSKSGKCDETLQTRPSCRYCGRPTHPRLECPARQAQCYNCNGKGHFGNVCEKKRRSTQWIYIPFHLPRTPKLRSSFE